MPVIRFLTAAMLFLDPALGSTTIAAQQPIDRAAAQAACARDHSTQLTKASQYDFRTLVERLEAGITSSNMLIVAKASASAAAEHRGITIPGDAVLMVFRNDFAVRMLQANVAAGIDAPIPIHVFEGPNGKASISYRRPSTVFKAYGNRQLDEMANELDVIFGRIVADAIKG